MKRLNPKNRKRGTKFHKRYIKDHAKRNTYKVINRRRVNKYSTGHQTRLF